MIPLERSPSITTQAFDTVEQAGVCCSSCAPIPIVSAAGTLVVMIARLSHSIYNRVRGRDHHHSRVDTADENNIAGRVEGDNIVVEVDSVAIAENPSVRTSSVKGQSNRSAGSDESDSSSRRRVVIVLRRDSDDEIEAIDITDVRE